MDYRNLGATGCKVSTLCLGTMTFGKADENSFMYKVGCDDETSYTILNAALDAGVNFLDTADVYGQDGLSERVIGSWFERDRRRDEVVLATKFRFTMGSGPNASGASRYRIMKCAEDSLRRLKTDRIDLYQIHMQDIDTPEEEILRALDDLIHQGKVLYAGCSNYAAYRLMDSLWISRHKNLCSFVTLQAQYSLVCRDIEREHLPLCRENGIGILPWSPLARGFLSGKYEKGADAPAGSRLEKWQATLAEYDNDRCWDTIGAVRAVASELGVTPAAVSLAWLLSRREVSSVIFGARSVQQLKDNLAAAELQLGAEHLAILERASATPPGYPYEFIGRVQDRW